MVTLILQLGRLRARKGACVTQGPTWSHQKARADWSLAFWTLRAVLMSCLWLGKGLFRGEYPSSFGLGLMGMPRWVASVAGRNSTCRRNCLFPSIWWRGDLFFSEVKVSIEPCPREASWGRSDFCTLDRSTGWA